jgi:hypothetical protein
MLELWERGKDGEGGGCVWDIEGYGFWGVVFSHMEVDAN